MPGGTPPVVWWHEATYEVLLGSMLWRRGLDVLLHERLALHLSPQQLLQLLVRGVVAR